MIPSALPLGSVPLCSWGEFTLDFTVLVSAAALEAVDATWLVEIDAYTDDGVLAVTSGPVLLGGLGWHPISALPFGSSTPLLKTLGYSDTGWIGEPSDAVKPNLLYEGRVVSPLRFSRSISVLPEQEVRVSGQFGAIELANGDGGLSDAVDQFAISGRRVRALRGARSSPFQARYTDFTAVMDGVCSGWNEDDLIVRVEIRDALAGLDLPMQGSLYAGTGGAEGPADFANKPKPAAFGYCLNITPDLVDSAFRVYRWHDGPGEEVIAVRDRGAALAIGTDYPNYAALTAATIPSGDVATCLALGLFRLNNTNTNAFITADVRGDNTGSYVDSHGDIALRILDRSSLGAEQILTPSFASLHGGSAGFYFPSTEVLTVSDALNVVVGSCAGWWGAKRDAKVMAGTMVPPDLQSIALDIDKFVRSDPIELSRPSQPRGRQKVGYAKLWTVQDNGTLVDSVSDADKQFYSQEYRTASSFRSETMVRYPFATDPQPLVSGLKLEADALVLADNLLNLHAVDRRMWSVSIGPEGYRLDLGKSVRWTPPRAPSRAWLVVGIEENGDDVTLTLWG